LFFGKNRKKRDLKCYNGNRTIQALAGAGAFRILGANQRRKKEMQTGKEK
jgi:hypothetical protein